jgi:hypothetical protein
MILGLYGNDTISADGSTLNGYQLDRRQYCSQSDDIRERDCFAYSGIDVGGGMTTGFSTTGGSGLDILDCERC